MTFAGFLKNTDYWWKCLGPHKFNFSIGLYFLCSSGKNNGQYVIDHSLKTMSQHFSRISRNIFQRQIKLTRRLGFNLWFSRKKNSFSLAAFQWDMLLDLASRGSVWNDKKTNVPNRSWRKRRQLNGLDKRCVQWQFVVFTFPFFLFSMGERGVGYGGVGCVISCYQSTLETPLWLDIFEDRPGLPVRNHPNPRGGLFVSLADTNKQKCTWHFYLPYSWMGFIHWLCFYVLS